MTHLTRRLLPLLAGTLAAAAVAALFAALLAAAPAAAASPAAPLLTATPGPTPTVEFSATLHLTAAQVVVEVGQPLALTVDLEVVEGCIYPIMDLSVVEANTGEPFFAHIQPAIDTISPGGGFPSLWTFRALRPGTARFAADTFGEGNCVGAWFWHSEGAWSEMVEVVPAVDRPYHAWLPTVRYPTGEDRR